MAAIFFHSDLKNLSDPTSKKNCRLKRIRFVCRLHLLMISTSWLTNFTFFKSQFRTARFSSFQSLQRHQFVIFMFMLMDHLPNVIAVCIRPKQSSNDNCETISYFMLTSTLTQSSDTAGFWWQQWNHRRGNRIRLLSAFYKLRLACATWWAGD